MDLPLDLWHSNNKKVIPCKFAKDVFELYTTHWIMLIVFLFLYWFYYLNGYTKWQCTKYKLLLTGSDISA